MCGPAAVQDVHTVRQGGMQHARPCPAVPILPGSHHTPASTPCCSLVQRTSPEAYAEDDARLRTCQQELAACMDCHQQLIAPFIVVVLAVDLRCEVSGLWRSEHLGAADIPGPDSNGLSMCDVLARPLCTIVLADTVRLRIPVCKRMCNRASSWRD